MPSVAWIDRHSSLAILPLAGLLVFALFAWQGTQYAYPLFDEGFLWYGVQRVMLGEVPIRDFMAYDPGRYYWSAALMGLWGDNGIMALRATQATAQAIGLAAGLTLIASSAARRRLPFLVLSAVTLVVWMYPHYKQIDILASIVLVGALAFLVRKPTGSRYFTAGLCVGLAAVLGRNHGVYGVAGSLGVMAWLGIGRAERFGLPKGLALWAAGVLAGFSPVLIMALLSPGFAVSFLESIRALLELGSTNLEHPVPWPWHVDLFALPSGEAIRDVLIGLFFVALVVFGVVSVAWVVTQRLRGRAVAPALVGAAFLSLPYAHYAYSRADVAHLALGSFPFLIGTLAVLAGQPSRIKWPLALVLGAASLWVMHFFQPGWTCRTGGECVAVTISGSTLQVDPGTANDVELLRKLVDDHAPDGRTFLATPYWPGAYPLFERKSPMWEIYALFPRSEAFQRAEIERIEAARPAFALIFDHPLDGREELRFSNTHQLIYEFIVGSFERIPAPPGSPYQIFRARQGGPAPKA